MTENVEQRLHTFKAETFKNSCSLFSDAALLYRAKRYSSSFSLAASSLEELGKMHMIDRGCSAMCFNPESAKEIFAQRFETDHLYKHHGKQGWAFFDGIDKDAPSECKWQQWDRWTKNGALEADRRAALYVELCRGTIRTPQRVGREKAKELLDLTYQALNGSGDLGFNGFYAISTSKSEWLAGDAIESVSRAYEMCCEE